MSQEATKQSSVAITHGTYTARFNYCSAGVIIGILKQKMEKIEMLEHFDLYG